MRLFGVLWSVPGLAAGACAAAAVDEHRLRNEAHRERERDGNEDQVVDKSDHRDEIRNDIDWRQRIRDAAGDDQLRVPRGSRIARGESERDQLDLDLPCPRLQRARAFLEHREIHHGSIAG